MRCGENAAVPPVPSARPERDNAAGWEQRAPASPPPSRVLRGGSQERPSWKTLATPHIYSPVSPPYKTGTVVSSADKLGTLEVRSLARLNLQFSACVSFSLSFSIPFVLRALKTLYSASANSFLFRCFASVSALNPLWSWCSGCSALLA